MRTSVPPLAGLAPLTKPLFRGVLMVELPPIVCSAYDCCDGLVLVSDSNSLTPMPIEKELMKPFMLGMVEVRSEQNSMICCMIRAGVLPSGGSVDSTKSAMLERCRTEKGMTIRRNPNATQTWSLSPSGMLRGMTSTAGMRAGNTSVMTSTAVIICHRRC